MKNKPVAKFIKYRMSDWLEIYQLAQELREERGTATSPSLSATTIEAVKFMRASRKTEL